jgi:hypothetical protein
MRTLTSSKKQSEINAVGVAGYSIQLNYGNE